MGAIAFASTLLGYINAVATIGGNVVEAVQWGRAKLDSFQGAEPTAADWDELNAKIAANTAALNQDPPA